MLGKPVENERLGPGTLEKRVRNIKAIWNNVHHDDIGIEKLIRLFLAMSQFLFAGSYIKQLFSKQGIAMQDLVTEFFVILKMCLPIFILYNHLQGNDVLFYLLMWFLLETMLYVPTLIFASDIFSQPRSYRRSMLLLFFNYMEIIFSFGVIYSRGHYLNRSFEHWYDPIYFSFITSATVGYGDYVPISGTGKLLVCVQSIVFLAFIVLFINFFSDKVEKKGYFDEQDPVE